MGKLELVLFDLDGVLVDTVPVVKRTYAEVARALGIVEPAEEKLKSAVRFSASQAVHYLFPDCKNRAASMYKQCWASNLKTALPFQGIPELLSWLSESGIKFGTVTSRNQADATVLLGNTGLLERMGVVITWGDYRVAKPNPACLLVALERMRTPPEGAAYVGDQPNDILAARRAGMVAIGATWDKNANKEALELTGANIVVAKPAEIINSL